jgi:TIR domain-containing protein
MPGEHLPQVFISSACQDHGYVEDLAHFLTRDGVTVWFDNWRVHLGDSIVRKIEDGLAAPGLLLTLVSRSFAASRWAGLGLCAATLRDLEDRGVLVLPLRIEDCPIPTLLADRRYIDLAGDAAKGYEDLLAAIDLHCAARGGDRRALLDTRLAVAQMKTVEESGFPIVEFTISNRSRRSQVIVGLDYDVVDYRPYYRPRASIPMLEPLEVWEVALPNGEGRRSYVPDVPVLLAAGTTAAIGLRFSCANDLDPRLLLRYGDDALYDGYPRELSLGKVAGCKVRARFISDQQLIAASELFSVWILRHG